MSPALPPSRPAVMFLAAALSSAAARADEGNPRIDYRGFAAGVAEVAALRESRRIDEDEFLALATQSDTVVRGARHLSFPDITADELAKVIPTKDTRVLISCDNNFENEEQAFPPKWAPAALNVHTFNVLHAYGYTNVHELKPLLDVRTTRIPFVGTTADGRGRYAQR